MAVVGVRPFESFPDFGAIFMCNKTTKNECFGSGIFGLPHPFANFVKEVKAGMLLFLFEYEARKLYGIFEATSDGGMNIIPKAYRSSGKSFPAQVRFRVVWKCCPIPEDSFRGAISDNYYEPSKFSFGLSKEQVERLVWLFHSRRVRVEKSPNVKNVKKDSTKSSDNMDVGCAAQINRNSSSGIPNIEFHTVVNCKTTSTDSLQLGDYIPLSDSEHSDPENYDSTKITKSSDGDDHSDPEHSEHFHKVKKLYCDTVQGRPSVFSRLQFGTRAVSHVQSLHLFQQEEGGGKEPEVRGPQPVNTLMKNLEKMHEKWMRQDTNPRQQKKRTNVFSRINFLPQVSMMHNLEANNVSFRSPVEANVSAKKRRRQACISDNGDVKNITVAIQVAIGNQMIR